MWKEKTDRYLEEHLPEMIDDICRLIRIDSVLSAPAPGKPYGEGAAEALSCASELAQNMGFAVRNYKNHVITADLNGFEPGVDILAHVDVVPAGNGWKKTEPFVPLCENGRLYGRGSADDKGPAVAALYAMRAVKELGIPLSKRARIILGADEENGSGDLAYYYSIEKEAPMSFSPDAEFPVVNVEKGRCKTIFSAELPQENADSCILEITAGTEINVVPGTARAVFTGLARKQLEEACTCCETKTGVSCHIAEKDGTLTVEITGTPAHASKPEDGNNALTALLSLVCALPLPKSIVQEKLRILCRLYPHGEFGGRPFGIYREDSVSGKLTYSFDTFSLTREKGKVFLRGKCDMRIPVTAAFENTGALVRAKLEENGFCCGDEDFLAPHHVEADTRLVKTLLKCYEECSGKEGACIAMGGLTYVHELKNGVAFGCAMPGTNNRMHGPDEFAEISELLLGAKMFARAIVELCS